MVSHLTSPAKHVQNGLRRLKRTIDGEAAPGGPSEFQQQHRARRRPPRYKKAAVALLACDLDLGAALYSLLDSSEPSAASPSARSVIGA